MRGFCIIMGFDGLGWFLHQFASIPLPSHVLGLLLLSAALFMGIVKLEWVEQSAGFLNRHMMLFFVPLLAGAAAFGPEIGSSWLAAILSLTAGTLTIVILTGLTTKMLVKRKERAGDEK